MSALHTTVRPEPSEYAPYYAPYMARVPEGNILTTLAQKINETYALLSNLSETNANFRYAPDKWSIKEVVGHLTDTERIMTYRALCFARGESLMLPGFDENAYVRNAKFSARSLADLLDEFRAVRAATVQFFASLDAEEFERRGKANNQPCTVRALAHVIAGHEQHHVAILRERYLSNPRTAERT